MMKDIIYKAYCGLIGEESFDKYDFSAKYSGKFSDFNANVKMVNNRIWFGLSKRWKGVDEDIVIGLLQSLLSKLFNKKIETKNIRLYNLFTKNVHLAAKRKESDEYLKGIFEKVNEEYFFGNIDMPNLRFGNISKRTLGSYNFNNDTITISRILEGEDPVLIEYVMYHEMLHKKLKFNTKNGRSYHHTSEFKRKEQEFKDFEIIQEKLKRLGSKRRVIKKKIRSLFDFF